MMDESTAFYGLLIIFGAIASIQLKFFTESALEKKIQKLKEKCGNVIRKELMTWVSEVYNVGKVTEKAWEKLITIIAFYNQVKEYDAKVDSYQRNAGYGLFSSLITALFAVFIIIFGNIEILILSFAWLALVSIYFLWTTISQRMFINKSIDEILQPCMFKEDKL